MSDIYITATTEDRAQTINTWRAYWYVGASQYWELKTVAWISQNKSNKTTTIKYKWQIEQNGYYPYWDDSHTYTFSFGGVSDSVSFSMPQSKTDGTRNMCSARTLGTFTHESDGTLSGTFGFEGARCGGWRSDGSQVIWTTFDEDINGSVPTITVTPTPTPEPEPEPVEPDPPTPIVFDNDPRFYVYSDNDLVYAAGVDGRVILNPKLSLEVNKAGSFTFDVPVGSEMYNKISKLKSTIEVRQGNEILFRGRLLNTKRNMMNTITCYCEGFLAWMNDISFQPYTFNGQARDLLKSYITRYNSRASANRQITYKYSDVSARVTISSENYSTAWKELKDVIIDGMGGYIVPYLTEAETGIQWLSSYGTTTSQVIQFGTNLLDFEEYIDASQLFTAVRAFGKEVDGSRVALSGNSGFVTNDDAIDVFGRIERTVFFDEITTESALRTAATDYLRTGIETALSLKLKAADLHLLDTDIQRIRLGNAVRSVSVPHGIDAYFMCIKIDLKLDDLKSSEYTFGANRRTISDMTDASYKKFIITEGA